MIYILLFFRNLCKPAATLPKKLDSIRDFPTTCIPPIIHKAPYTLLTAEALPGYALNVAFLDAATGRGEIC